MNTICTTCGDVAHWRNKRGNTMPRICRAPVDEERECGGRLALATFKDGAWVEAVRKKQPARHKAACAICARPGMVPGKLRVLAAPETFNVVRSEFSGAIAKLVSDQAKKETYQAGAVVCRWHESFEQRRADNNATEPYPVYIKIKC